MRLKLAGLVVAAFSLLVAPSAFAADMPTKMPVKAAPMAAATPWTGFYVNGGVGYGIWAGDQNVITTATGACLICETQFRGGKGWLATVGAGYDYQFTNKIVAGVFGDFSGSSLKGNVADRFANGATGASGDIKQTSSWAAGARVGWLVTPQTLSYWNGGYTSASFSDAPFTNFSNGAATGFSTPSFRANGWFLGGGLETSIAAGWFLRTEYRYAYYGTKTLDETAVATGRSVTFRPTVQTVTGQVVYKFNGGMPTPVYPATPAVATNWTGFHASAGIGYGMWAADNISSTAGFPVFPVNGKQVSGGKGYLGRIGAGYDWQFAPVWVAGVFGDFDVSSLKGSLDEQFNIQSGIIKQTSAWAGGARIGWLPSPQTLTYVNGGFTAARFSGTTMITTNTAVPSGATTPAFTTSGWFAGGGIETTADVFGILGKGWFWRTEYRYAQFGEKTVTPVNNPFAAVTINFKPVTQTVTTSLVFKFN